MPLVQGERDAEAMKGEMLPTSRAQLTYGAHVLVTMFTLFSLGYYGSKHYLGFSELMVGVWSLRIEVATCMCA